MGSLFIFILISVLVISGLLFFNKGEKAQETKNILNDIYENIKEIISNLKKLFLILKELTQSNAETEVTQLEAPSDDSTPDSSQAQPDIIAETEIDSTSELEAPSDDSINTNSTDIKND